MCYLCDDCNLSKEINTNIPMHQFQLNTGVRLLGIIEDNTVYSSAENKCQDI